MEKINYKKFLKKNWPNKNYKYHLEYCKILFKNINLKNNTLLDIGCGDGLFSYYAYSQGTKKIVCIEPEIDGSTKGVINKFKKIKNKNKFKNINVEIKTFQKFKSNKKFDLILLNNSINHLNEKECVNLHKSKKSQEIYLNLLEKINKLLKKEGKIILTDCSRYNFWNSIRLQSPFAKTIDWHKHQTAEFWINLMKKKGFKKIKIDWTIYHRLPELKFIFNNKFASYFLNSHFRIVMKKI